MTIRTFICIEVPQPLLKQCDALQKKLEPFGKGVRWSRIGGLHLTLKFLGDVPEQQLAAVAGAVGDAVRETPPFDYKLKNCDAFPNFKRPRVFWVGIEEPAQVLSMLHQRLEKALAEIGFAKEKRRFSPHLTLGRVKSADGVREISGFLQRENFETRWTKAQAVTVMKSELKSAGAEYTPLFTFTFERKSGI